MPKVSVIVPIYGVEAYIERCARSLFEQTLEDIEYIFVDDCTKDNSISVLEKVIKDYPNRVGQVHVLHHEVNKGLSRARETGVKYASGEYIAHCDSDDWIERDAYKVMYEFALSTNKDFVKAAHFVSDGTAKTIKEVYGTDDVTKESVIGYLLSCKGWNSIWDTLAKRSLYEHVVFTDDTMLEDFFVVTQLLLTSERIGVIKQPFYYYFQNNNSICHNTDEQVVVAKAFQAYRNVTFIIGKVRDIYGDKYRKEAVVLKYTPRRILIPIMDNTLNYQFWKELYDGNKFEVLLSPFLGSVLKQQYYMVEFHLYSLYRKFVSR